ncbi:MAG: hypothetical protein F6K41_07915 [Symploca sp. SIO3E6]|nr:hypothetical protein [Caldora sp. SIO3E6]
MLGGRGTVQNYWTDTSKNVGWVERLRSVSEGEVKPNKALLALGYAIATPNLLIPSF